MPASIHWQFLVLPFKQLTYLKEAPETLVNILDFPNNVVPLNQGIV